MIELNLLGLSVGKQCALLSIARSSIYHASKVTTPMNPDLMQVIYKLFLRAPF